MYLNKSVTQCLDSDPGTDDQNTEFDLTVSTDAVSIIPLSLMIFVLKLMVDLMKKPSRYVMLAQLQAC